MDVWIARYLGPLFFVLALPMLITPDRFRELARGFVADSPLILVSGVLAMTGGLAIVNTHNVWVLGWPLIVTVFGWALLLGGAVRIVAPHIVARMGDAMLERPQLLRGVGLFWGALGAFLTLRGYG